MKTGLETGHLKKAGFLLFFLFCAMSLINAQEDEDEFESLLHQEVENINPVYKPVLGFGIGVLNYLGDVKNNYYSPTIGTLGYKVNLATYLDNKRYFKGEFFFQGGKLNGNERSFADPDKNFNFQTDIYNFGIDLNYDFDHLYKKKDKRIHPFISVGIGTLLFNSRTDSTTQIYDPVAGTYNTVRYHYWNDGTIRDIPQSMDDGTMDHFINRDFKFETPLRNTNWGLGQYTQYGIMIPLDFGIDMQISDRMMIRLGHSFVYTFTDAIDHVSSKNTSGRIGKPGNDMYNFTYVTFHLDLFSSAKTLKINRLFLDQEFDPMLMGDEDNDGWPDAMDECPATPLGVSTDSAGCPLDSDDDGIYDYLDKEQFSRRGAYVNNEGVEITEEALIAMLNHSMAVGRNEIDLYIRKSESYNGRRGAGVPVPDKFKTVDTDKDNYISFDEMLKEIDRYFDFESNLTANEIYELNSFFFAQ
ncbi:MAG TPA: hypothetical protein VHI78_11860 [Bacteroidales bacterium]|jgi:hypothetical protein|nr:hypothetical protein [Bacteroidales bacterium]